MSKQPITEEELNTLKASRGQGEWAAGVAAIQAARDGELPIDWDAKVIDTDLRAETLRRAPPDTPWGKRVAASFPRSGRPDHVRSVEAQKAIDERIDRAPKFARLKALQGKTNRKDTEQEELDALLAELDGLSE